MPIVQFFGGIFLVICLCVDARGLWRWCRWEHAIGKIVDYVSAAGSEYDDYFSKTRVSNRPGGTIEFVSAIGGTGKPWAIGANVKRLRERSSLSFSLGISGLLSARRCCDGFQQDPTGELAARPAQLQITFNKYRTSRITRIVPRPPLGP